MKRERRQVYVEGFAGAGVAERHRDVPRGDLEVLEEVGDLPAPEGGALGGEAVEDFEG